MALRAPRSLTTEVIKDCSEDGACHSPLRTPAPLCELPVPRGAAEYTGWFQHPSLGARMTLQLSVMCDDGQWIGEGIGAGSQRQRLSIDVMESGKVVIRNVEGRHVTELSGHVTQGGILRGTACQDGVPGGTFRLWPMRSGRSFNIKLQRLYVALRSGPCWHVPACKPTQDLPSECAICLEGFAPEDMICRTRCAGGCHVFHRTCIQQWLESHETCPLCRHVLHKGAKGSGSRLRGLIMTDHVAFSLTRL